MMPGDQRIAAVTVLLIVLLSHYQLLLVLAFNLINRPRRPRLWVVRPRSGHYWAELLAAAGQGGAVPRAGAREEYRAALRMSPELFAWVCGRLRPALERDPRSADIRGYVLSVEHIVAAVLYRLAHGAGLHAVSNLFGLAPGTLSVLTVEVCSAIVRVLLPEFICLPPSDRVQEVVAGFQARSGLPNCFGAVDGTHIPLKGRPREALVPGDYWCVRKNCYSIVMQAVVDSRGRFLDIDVRWPGRCHDSFIFHESWFGRVFPSLYPEHRVVLGGVHVPLYVVADSAYKLSPCCIKRYVAGPHHGPSAAFDTAVSACRIVVENAFSRLKGRWRILSCMTVKPENAAVVVAACAVLHNVCEALDPGAQFGDGGGLEPPEGVVEERVVPGGGTVRDALRDHFMAQRAA
jgi:hypothetical protein